eukprot:scaffold1637_cov410-Prasinococcus_capsulatus_cf.AAC.8
MLRLLGLRCVLGLEKGFQRLGPTQDAHQQKSASCKSRQSRKCARQAASHQKNLVPDNGCAQSRLVHFLTNRHHGIQHVGPAEMLTRRFSAKRSANSRHKSHTEDTTGSPRAGLRDKHGSRLLVRGSVLL